MATFDALERLQKFDWLIQKLHSLRSTLQSEQGLQELQKLHALKLLQKSEFQFNESSVGESEEDKMELCKNDGEEENEELEEEDEDEEEDLMDEEYLKEEEQTLPLALTTSVSDGFSSVSPIQSVPRDPANTTVHSASSFLRSPVKPSPDIERKNGFSPVRFPTGLFPPLPFEGMFSMLNEDQELKVGLRKQNLN